MSSSKKSSPKKRRPLRKLLLLAVITGTAVAIKNALEDKGGSYEAPAAPTRVPTPATPSAAPAPAQASAAPASSVRTAEDIVKRPVENLDEFADPVPVAVDEPAPEPTTRVHPTVDPLDEAVADVQPVDDATPVADEPDGTNAPQRERRSRKRAAADAIDELHQDAPGKIDPFGIR